MATSSQRGLFFVLVGPGGAGKDTLLKQLFERLHPESRAILNRLVTATSRPQRDKERDGIDYHFKTREQFQEMIAQNALIEYKEVTTGNFYGVPRASVESIIEKGHHVIGAVEVLGAKDIRANYPHNAILIFVTVDGKTDSERLDVLRTRMENRTIGKDSPQVIQERIDRARTLELPFAEEAHHVIVNDDLERATQTLLNIVTEEIQKHAQEAQEEGKAYDVSR